MRRLRAERGLSQEAFAHESGINRTYLSGVERSERNVSIDNIAPIARGRKVKPSVLLDDSALLHVMVGIACCPRQPGFSAATTFRIGDPNGLSTASETDQTWF